METISELKVTLVAALRQFNSAEQEVIFDFLKGHTIHSLSEKHNLTEKGIIQITDKLKTLI